MKNEAHFILIQQETTFLLHAIFVSLRSYFKTCHHYRPHIHAFTYACVHVYLLSYKTHNTRGPWLIWQRPHAPKAASPIWHTALAVWHTAPRLFPKFLAQSISNKIAGLAFARICYSFFRTEVKIQAGTWRLEQQARVDSNVYKLYEDIPLEYDTHDDMLDNILM